jgi:hypothetical protein
MSMPSQAATLARPAGAGPAMLASDLDRDRIAGVLNEAFAEGRLTAAEHGERIQAAYAARAWTELAPLTADLPGPDDGPTERPALAADGLDRCLLMWLLVVLCPPVGIAWLLATRCRTSPGEPYAQDR